MSDAFLLIYPVWVIVTRDSVVLDRGGKRARLAKKARFYFINVSDKSCVPIFTDIDLAQRHMEDNNVADCAIMALGTNERLVEKLAQLKAQGCSLVAFDPGKPGLRFRYGQIGTIIEELKKNE